MDETSRTGIQRYNNDKWNFQDQPYFGLGALYVPSYYYDRLYNQLEAVIKKENISGEFKWSNKDARRKAKKMLPDLLNVIKQNKASVHFEIEDKRYSIAKLITEYCVIPFYSYERKMGIQYLKRAFASYISDNLSNELLWEICSFFDSGELDTYRLKILIAKVIAELDTEAIKLHCSKCIGLIEQFEAGTLPVEKINLFPVKDTIKHNGTKSTITVDPHTDCFSDLLCNAFRYYPGCNTLLCYHDVQDQWKPALEEAIERLKEYIENDSIVLETVSGYHTIINAVDYISGALNNSLRGLFDEGKEISEQLDEICSESLTIVASISLQEKIWHNNPDVLVAKALYTTIGMKKTIS